MALGWRMVPCGLDIFKHLVVLLVVQNVQRVVRNQAIDY
jgi:hypothetical protein